MSVFLTHFALLMPTFSLPCSPPVLADELLPAGNAPLPMNDLVVHPAASAICLAPCIFGAEILDQ